MKFDPTLYLVTDSTGRTDDDFLSILERALTGGVTLVQLREKEREILHAQEYALAKKSAAAVNTCALRTLQKLFATATVCRLSSTTARTSPWRQMRRAYT